MRYSAEVASARIQYQQSLEDYNRRVPLAKQGHAFRADKGANQVIAVRVMQRVTKRNNIDPVALAACSSWKITIYSVII